MGKQEETSYANLCIHTNTHSYTYSIPNKISNHQIDVHVEHEIL